MPASRIRVLDGVREWQLERAAGRSPYRFTTARLTGLRHIPPPVVPPSARPTTTAPAMRSGRVEARTAEISSAAARVIGNSHSPFLRGRAFLAKGEWAQASEELKEAAKSGDPRAFSDLAAALLAEADGLDAIEPALDAMVAARKAIAAAPDLAAAHFNLALALERIGLTNEARTEFDRAAACEPESEWASEARRRSAALRPGENDWDVTERLLRVTTDPVERERLIRTNVERARAFAESRYLADWAELRVAGHVEKAAQTLELERSVGKVLKETSGERLVADAVEAIDAAEARGDGQALRMAAALNRYAVGRRAARDRNEALAISELDKAAKELAKLDSPLQYVARYYRTGALYEDSRTDQALSEIHQLEIESKRYRCLLAQLGWPAGSCLMARGSYAEALHQFDRSYEMSIANGERNLAANFDGFAAQALEYLGQSREAWQRRSRALRQFSTSPNTVGIMSTLFNAANLQLVARKPDRAHALLDYTLPLALQQKDPLVVPYTFAQRSAARSELGDAEGAAADRSRGWLWLKRLPTSSMKERIRAELDIAEGVAKRVSHPREAIAHFTKAIDLVRPSGQSLPLPHLYFERARAHEAAKDVEGQRKDLLAGRAVVEEWERSTPDKDQRAAIATWGETMRRDLIFLELGAGDLQAAFVHAEDRETAAPARERSLTLPEIQRALAPGAAIVEFVIIRDRVVAFVIRSEGAWAVWLPAGAARIAAAVEAMRNAAAAEAMRSADDGFPEAAAVLHDLIVAPIERHLDGVSTLAVIPDRELTGISFGALFDAARNQYLIERMAVVNDETADAAIRLSKLARGVYGSSLLSVGASVFDRERYPGAAKLTAVEREATDVAKQARAEPLLGNRATPDNVSRRLKDVAGAHFAGHIVGRGTDARMLLAPFGGRDGITAHDIGEMDLRGLRFVVLAACRGSGSGESNAIVRDMATGFLKAGVPTVVGSSTDVDDNEAPGTMLRLHQFLLENGDPAEALRLTARQDRQKSTKVPLSVRLLVMGGAQALVR